MASCIKHAEARHSGVNSRSCAIARAGRHLQQDHDADTSIVPTTTTSDIQPTLAGTICGRRCGLSTLHMGLAGAASTGDDYRLHRRFVTSLCALRVPRQHD